jgi:hypothetical protein
MQRGLIPHRGRANGEIAHENQSQRLLGVDSSNGAVCVFRGAVAGKRGQRQQCDGRFEIGHATSANSTKQSSRHSKRDAHGKSRSEKSSETSSDTNKAADTGGTDAGGPAPSAIPASVANANAQLTANASADSASAMSAKANTLLAGADGQPGADGQVVSSDQLNDVDRALQPTRDGARRRRTVAMAPSGGIGSPALASGNDSSTWDQTSLIGKIFIASAPADDSPPRARSWRKHHQPRLHGSGHRAGSAAPCRRHGSTHLKLTSAAGRLRREI